MPDENRVPLFVRIPPALKNDLGRAAWSERVSVSRYVETALLAQLRQKEAQFVIAE